MEDAINHAPILDQTEKEKKATASGLVAIRVREPGKKLSRRCCKRARKNATGATGATGAPGVRRSFRRNRVSCGGSTIRTANPKCAASAPISGGGCVLFKRR